MSNIITISNHGPLITASNYWGSEMEQRGLIYCSTNGGAVRVLVPQSQRHMIEEMRTAKEVILSRGPWPEQRLSDAVELLFDDGTSDPFALHLSPSSFDFLPAEPPDGQEWILTVWDLKKGRPHCAMTRICHWRRVDRLPCLLPWKE